jgi:type III secretion protein U
MKEETEEKTLPATRKKISDARRKGQVSHSKDLITGFGLLIAVAYLLREWPTMRAQVMDLFDLVSASVDLPFAEVRQRALAHAVQALLIMIIPLVVMVFAGSVIAGMIGTLGPVFSFESVKLKFEHINPVQGAKRIFSLRNLVEFAKSVAKVGILTVAFWAVMSGFVRPLFETPACGDACLGPMVVSTLTPLAVTAAIAFVAIAHSQRAPAHPPSGRYRANARRPKTCRRRHRAWRQGCRATIQSRRRAGSNGRQQGPRRCRPGDARGSPPARDSGH